MSEMLAGIDDVVESRLVAPNTVRYRRGDGLVEYIRLYRTDILEKRLDGYTVFRTGDYHTASTRDRLNSFQDQCRIKMRHGVLWIHSPAIPRQWAMLLEGTHTTGRNTPVVWPGMVGDVLSERDHGEVYIWPRRNQDEDGVFVLDPTLVDLPGLAPWADAPEARPRHVETYRDLQLVRQGVVAI